MSTHAVPRPQKRLTIRDIIALKQQRAVICLTAYTAPMASLLDPHMDVLLVGDSLGMVLYGMESTLPVTLEDMIRHGRTVMQASHHACVIVDMPFGSYQASKEAAFDAAARILKETGAQGVKLEGGEEMVETISFLTSRAIPVMAHIGLKPQHVHSMGGYRYQGRNDQERENLKREALLMQQAGAFALLMEGMEVGIAADITQSVSIPTIGIGAGKGCNGQILVTEDMLGLSEHTPKFVRQFADLRSVIAKAVQEYAEAVTQGEFPATQHAYGV